ncbi:MAG: hypothetical protein IJJ98_11200 [Prevotella sp.]|nr:hypothetical protein [Prevotella sp.]
MSKKECESVLKQVAQIRIGEFEATLTEEDLRLLYDLKDEADEEQMPSYLDEILDLLISFANESTQPSDEYEMAEIMANLGVLQRLKKRFRLLRGIQIAKQK